MNFLQILLLFLAFVIINFSFNILEIIVSNYLKKRYIDSSIDSFISKIVRKVTSLKKEVEADEV